MKLSERLSLAGFVFIAGVSIAGAFKIESTTWRFLLILSAVVSLVLAIAGMLKNKDMAQKIQKLDKNQLSVWHDENEESLHIEKGMNIDK